MKKISLLFAAFIVVSTLSSISLAKIAFNHRPAASRHQSQKKTRAIILQRRRQNPRAIILQRKRQNPRAIILQRNARRARTSRSLGPDMKRRGFTFNGKRRSAR